MLRCWIAHVTFPSSDCFAPPFYGESHMIIPISMVKSAFCWLKPSCTLQDWEILGVHRCSAMVCMKHPMLRVKAPFLFVRSSCLLFGLLNLRFCKHPLSLFIFMFHCQIPIHHLWRWNPHVSPLPIWSQDASNLHEDVDLQRWDLETIQDPLRRKHWDSLGMDLQGPVVGGWKVSLKLKMMVKKAPARS